MISRELKELSIGEIENLGVDVSMIDICRQIRKNSKLGKIRIDDSKVSINNAELLMYLDYCEYFPIGFFEKYLSQLQPYMLFHGYDQNHKDIYICLIDNTYQISIRILDNNHGIEIYLDTIDCIRDVTIKQDKFKRYVPVFAKSLGSIDYSKDRASVDVLITRGMMTLPISIIGVKYKDVFIVKKLDIEKALKEYCDQYIRDLYTSNLSLDFSKIEVFSMLQQLEFTAYGNDTFTSISLLLDAFNLQKDFISKRTADFVLVTFIMNLRLTIEQGAELLNLLKERYKKVGNIDNMLHRVEMYLNNYSGNQ